MPVCSIVKLLPLGTVDDLIHYCTWPRAIVHQVIHSTLGNSFDYTTNKHEITVYSKTSRSEEEIQSCFFSVKTKIFITIKNSCKSSS